MILCFCVTRWSSFSQRDIPFQSVAYKVISTNLNLRENVDIIFTKNCVIIFFQVRVMTSYAVHVSALSWLCLGGSVQMTICDFLEYLNTILKKIIQRTKIVKNLTFFISVRNFKRFMFRFPKIFHY